MTTQHRITGISVFLGLGFSWLVAGAAEVYHWTDAQGTPHFSQWAPAEEELDYVSLTVRNTNPTDYDPLDDRYSIKNQADRISAQWKSLSDKRAALTAEKRKLAQERLARETAAMNYYRYQEPVRYYATPIWLQYAYHHKRPRKHGQGYRPKAEHYNANHRRPSYPDQRAIPQTRQQAVPRRTSTAAGSQTSAPRAPGASHFRSGRARQRP